VTASYDHGSAQNINIITQFICDTLVNKCGADAQARATCDTAKTAAAGAADKTGAQADAFNAVFGKTTDFAAVPAVDNQGQVIPGTGNGNGAAAPAPSATPAPAQSNNNDGDDNAGDNDDDDNTGGSNNGVGNVQNNAAAGGIGDFGSCSVPEIEFGAGFDGRRETSFQPVDKSEFSSTIRAN
jgi:hypothetical protein